MATLFRRNLSSYKQLKKLHFSTNGISVPTFNINAEKQAFLDVMPEVINSVVTGPKLADLPEVKNWVEKLLDYMLGNGKLGRGLMVSVGYKMFEDPSNYSEETQHSARVLGWCTEMLNTTVLILDDIVDDGLMRRGKLCWHRQPFVGLSGINDGLLMYQSAMEVLDMYFGKTPIYTDLLRYFNETVYRLTIGEHLDICSGYNRDKDNIDMFNINRTYEINVNKTAHYSFKLPIFVPLLLVKNGKEKATKELDNICMEFGKLVQCQDDYLDAYGDELVMGKTRSDIQGGKCTWVSATALQHCNEAQRTIFKQFYGSNNPDHVERIKQLYDELKLPQLYEEWERTTYNQLMQRIQALPAAGAREFLLQVLNTTYKRVK